MPAKKTIIIEFPTNTNDALTHQVRNFGEDLCLRLEEENLGDMGGIRTVDRATDKLIVRVSHTRKVGTVRKLVEKILKQHLLDNRSEVTYR